MTAGYEAGELETLGAETDHVQTQLDHRILHLKTLYDISNDVFSSVEPGVILKNFLLMTLGNFGVVEGFVLSLALPSADVRHLVSLGLSDDELGALRRAAKRIQVGGTESSTASLWEWLHQALPPFIHCTVPFRVTSEHAAILGLGSKLTGEPYSEDDRELLTTLANNLAVALKNAESFESIKSLNKHLHLKNAELEDTLDKLTTAYEDLQAAQAQIIEKEKLERELMVAREIQRSILPCSLPDFAGFDLGSRIYPARAVGGDFFDLILLGPDALGVAVGDVSDKGVPAAIFMAVTRSLIRSEATRTRSPREAMLSVNGHLLEMNNANMFVTVLYGILDGKSGEFSYVRAGHDPPLLFSRAGKTLRPSYDVGQALGVFPDPLLDEQTMLLQPGDTLLVYTDGVTDARDAQSEFFGLERISKAVCDGVARSAQELCDHLLKTVTDFQQSAPQDDDVTLVAVRRWCNR
ncbi:MAG: PP2C family protein-serine/threonine phosphatase [Syntrophobacteraceae bacterium]